MTIMWLLFSFKGRINRLPFWLFILALNVLFLIIAIISPATEEEIGTLELIFTLIIIWPLLAVQAKRWHDTDRSAWWILINFVPIIGWLWAFIVNGCFRGTSGANRYGEDPLDKKYQQIQG